MYRVKWSDPGPNKKIKKFLFPNLQSSRLSYCSNEKHIKCVILYTVIQYMSIFNTAQDKLNDIQYNVPEHTYMLWESFYHCMSLTYTKVQLRLKKIFSGIFRKIKMSAKLWHILRKRLNIRVNEYFRPTGGEQLTMVIAWLVATVCG